MSLKHSDTLQYSVNSNDRLTIQLVVHSRLTVWYRPTIERLHEADTTIDFPSAGPCCLVQTAMEPKYGDCG